MRCSAWLAALALLIALPAGAMAYRAPSAAPLTEVVNVRALRYGDTGPAVAELQALLRQRGFNPGPVDGIFGPLTEAAVIAAQRHYGLDVDGLAGRMTVSALREEAVPSPAQPAARGERPHPPEPAGVTERYGGWPSATSLTVYDAAQRRQDAPTRAGAGSVDLRTAAPQAAALTFHHLPPPAALAALLQDLQQYGARATFFVTGEGAERRPEDLQRIRAAGHDIGSLGYREVDMRSLTPGEARAALRRARQAVAAAAGEPPVLFRPPLGRFDRRLSRMAEEEGMRLVLWSNALTPPGEAASPEELAAHALRALRPGAVILVPLDAAGGVDAARLVLAELTKAGYRTERLIDIVTDKN